MNFIFKNTGVNNNHHVKTLLTTLITLSLSTLMGCGKEDPNHKEIKEDHNHEESKNNYAHSDYEQLKKIESDDLDIKNDNSLIQKPLRSYMAKHKKTCPQLLIKNIDTSVISRNKEFLHGKYCDYYIYPNINQKLTVNTHGEAVKVSLVMPLVKPLSNNQSYIIDESRRHVIRVEYNGVQIQPKDFIYHITINLQDM